MSGRHLTGYLVTDATSLQKKIVVLSQSLFTMKRKWNMDAIYTILILRTTHIVNIINGGHLFTCQERQPASGSRLQV